MTIAMGRGTIQMSGLYEDLLSECQLPCKPRLSSHYTVCLLSLWPERKKGLLMDSARSVRAGFDQSRISEAGYCMMIFLGLLSALNPVPFNGQHSFK